MSQSLVRLCNLQRVNVVASIAGRGNITVPPYNHPARPHSEAEQIKHDFIVEVPESAVRDLVSPRGPLDHFRHVAPKATTPVAPPKSPRTRKAATAPAAPVAGSEGEGQAESTPPVQPPVASADEQDGGGQGGAPVDADEEPELPGEQEEGGSVDSTSTPATTRPGQRKGSVRDRARKGR